MAEDTKAPKKKRQLKKTETVRERAERVSEAEPKPRRVRHTVGQAGRPVRATGRIVARGARPFGFLLKPFRTRPMRFVGRTFAKVFGINYVINSWRELRLVTWPNRRETTKLTIAVFVFAITFALLISVVDFGLDKVFRALLT